MNKTLPQNIDELFALALNMAGQRIPEPFRNRLEWSIVDELLEANDMPTVYHPNKPSEVVIVHEETTSWHPTFHALISESFLEECFDGKFGGREASLDLLVNCLDESTPRIVV